MIRTTQDGFGNTLVVDEDRLFAVAAGNPDPNPDGGPICALNGVEVPWSVQTDPVPTGDDGSVPVPAGPMGNDTDRTRVLAALTQTGTVPFTSAPDYYPDGDGSGDGGGGKGGDGGGDIGT
jgi:hypothetical protein